MYAYLIFMFMVMYKKWWLWLTLLFRRKEIPFGRVRVCVSCCCCRRCEWSTEENVCTNKQLFYERTVVKNSNRDILFWCWCWWCRSTDRMKVVKWSASERVKRSLPNLCDSPPPLSAPLLQLCWESKWWWCDDQKCAAGWWLVVV